MATIPKAQWRTSALTSAAARLQLSRRPGAGPQVQNHVVSVVVAASAVAAPDEPTQVVGATRQVPLVRILDSFRQLEDPKSRVIGGFFYGSPDELTTESDFDEITVQGEAAAEPVRLGDTAADRSPHAVFSGVASPGSQVSVTIADEVGQPIESRTVYTDAGGNWLAPFGRLSTLDESGLISIEVLPSTWSGQARPSHMMFDFPARRIIEHGERGRGGDGNFFAAVFEGGKHGGLEE